MSSLAAYRPLFWLTLAFLGGILLQAGAFWGMEMLAIVFIVLALILERRRVRRAKLRWYWLLLAISAGWLYTEAHWQALPAPLEAELDRQVVRLQGTVVGFPRQQNLDWYLELDDLILHYDGQQFVRSGRMRLHLYAELPEQEDAETVFWQPGDCLEAEARLSRYRPGSNFGDPDWALMFHRRGIIASASADLAEARLLLRSDATQPSMLIWRARQFVTNIFRGPGQGWLAEEWVELLAGLSIGCNNELPEHWDTAFRQAGLIHVLVVSGGHFVALLLLLRRSLRLLPMSLGKEQILLSLAVVGYTLLTGAQDSILRASITALLSLAADRLQRRTEWPSLLMLSLLLQVLLNPYALFEAGLQLSYAAVAGLCMWTPFFERCLATFKLPQVIRGPLSGTLAAQLGVLPISVQLFNQVSVIAPLSNLFCAVLIAPLQFLTLLLLLLSPFGEVATAGLAMLLHTLLRILVGIAEFTASLPGAIWNLPSPGWLLLSACYLWLLMLTLLPLRFLNRRRRAALSVLLVAALLLPVFHPWPRPLELVVLDVGQGDALFVRFPNGRTMLIDGGGSPFYTSEVGRRTILPFLRRQGVQKLDWAVLSHPHEDHYQGLLQVVDRFPVDYLVGPALGQGSATPQELRDWLEKQPTSRYRALNVAENLIIDAAVPVEVRSVGDLHQDATYAEVNAASVVLRLEYGTTVLWLTGDAESSVEQALLAGLHEDGKKVALKVAHHGSRSATSADWLEALAPQAALITVGARNTYGHPHGDVLQRLANQGCLVWRTDIHGALRLCSDGGRWEIETVFK